MNAEKGSVHDYRINFFKQIILNRSLWPEKSGLNTQVHIYHVLNRGNHRQWIFETDGDKKAFLLCLKEAAQSGNWKVHAWCLMANPYHIAIETPEANPVAGMKWL